MTLGRREFVIGSVGAAALAQLGSGCSDSKDNGAPDAGPDEPELKPIAELSLDEGVFAHGVASGDPLSDAIILWTRISSDAESETVRWVIANDEDLKNVVKSGSAKSDKDSDFTVKVDVDGLKAGQTYYYAFARAEEARSVIGRARTLPAEGVDHVRFAFTSCANYNNGYFHAYRAIRERDDLDVWIHLGDYIYEYADAEYGDPSLLDRVFDPKNEAISLADYRKRYAQVRSDEEVRELHRKHTCIVVWDDHEVADNASLTGAVNHMPDEGDWQTRVKAGTQAFKEWLPLRLPDPKDPARIYRRFEFGKLFDLIMIDSRLYGRDAQAGGLQNAGDPAVWVDPKRQLLGQKQEDWLKEQLSTSRERGTTWRVLGNQVIFAENRDPLKTEPTILNADAWDGYQPARERIVSHIKQNGIDNLVVLTGDIHTSWAFDLAEDPFDMANYDPATGKGSFGVELVGPAVTSLGLEDDATLSAAAPILLPQTHPHLKFVEVTKKGYVLVDVKEDRVQAEWYLVADHKKNDDAGRATSLFKAYACNSKSAHLVETMTPSAAKARA